MAGWYFKKEIVPFTTMAIEEFAVVGINTLYKAATLKGLNYFVFIGYTSVIGTLVLVPLPFIIPRIILISVIGYENMRRLEIYNIWSCDFGRVLYTVCEFLGIAYSSPTLASAISNLTPAFTYIFAIIFRMEVMNLRSSITRIKIIGTVVSISGALVAVLYKGPAIISPESSSPQPLSLALQYPLGTTLTNWVVGGLFLVSQTFLGSIWCIFQMQVIELYPAEQTVTLLYFLCKTIIAVPICFLAETKWSAWTLRTDMWITIIISGLFGPSFATLLCIWGLHLKGPLYISIFKPFSIAVAAAFGVIFLGDALCLGSVLGATILLVGFFAVIWGKAQVEDTQDSEPDNLGASSDRKTPLLQS